jgi:hypothetical protein
MDLPDQPELGPSLPPVGRWVRRAVRARFVLLGLYLLLAGGWYFLFLSGSDPVGMSFGVHDSTAQVVITALVGTAILFGVQLLFLAGAPQWRWPRPRRKRSIYVSIAAGALIAMMLSAGIFTALYSLWQLIFTPGAFSRSLGAIQLSPISGVVTTSTSSWELTPLIVVAIGLSMWVFWFVVFAIVGGSQWSQRFRWIYRALIAGTVIELLITIPIDAQVRRRTNCYCGEGTFFSLIVGLTAILWTFGPGVAILFFIRRNQLASGAGLQANHRYCEQCGYDLHGLQSARCPECGMVIGDK